MLKQYLTLISFGFGALVLLTACSDRPTNENAAAQSEPTIGINVAAMDTSVVPGDDFYSYANGEWMRTTEIPSDRSRASTFFVATETTEKRNNELIDKLVEASHPAGSDESRVAAYYKAYMDTAAIDAAGMTPVQPHLASYAAIADRKELSWMLGANLRADVDPLNATDYFTQNLFGVFVTQGLATPGEVLPYLLQGGLGMPRREHYLSSEPQTVAIRESYRNYIEELLSNAGIDDATTRADRIFALETKIAEAHVSRADSEDFTKSAAVWSREDLDNKAPGIDWELFLAAAKLGDQEKFAAYHAGAIPGLSALVASEPLEAWKDWLTYHHISMYADTLPSYIDDTRFAFHGTVLFGTPEQRPREKRALTALGGHLGDAVGRAYAEAYFPASAKAQVASMVDTIVDAFHRRVEAIDWMAASTKSEALEKVSTIVVGVGYPDTWRDYSNYEVVDDNAYANAFAGRLTEYAHQLAKLGKPLDKREWWMSPQVVNAVNLPVQNALNFPAGILQPPFFDENADPAFNYGAIGVVIGHEISHSFDNNGAAFDSTGAMRNWWTDVDFAEFGRLGDALAAQFDAYRPFEDLHVNGELTLGENIADVAGLAAAYDGYRASLNGEEAPIIDGLTGDQRFFIAYAQIWGTKWREEALRQQILNGVHAPGQFRALTIRNLDAWYDAFDVQPEHELYLAPEDRVLIW